MSCLGNIIWLCLAGLPGAFAWFFFGIIWSITIIGIPIGHQCFKMARLQLAPFGKEVIEVETSSLHFIFNVLWFILCGWELVLINLISAAAFAITIIGIPFALQSLKLAKLSLSPFGKRII